MKMSTTEFKERATKLILMQDSIALWDIELRKRVAAYGMSDHLVAQIDDLFAAMKELRAKTNELEKDAMA